MPLELHWLRPAWLLLLPPLALLLAVLALRVRRARRWEDLVDAQLRPLVLTGAQATRPWPLLAALAVGWLMLVLALAGPAWQLTSRPVFRIEQPRVLLLDLSRSMQAVDVAPSRLARARFEVMDLLRTDDEGQFALIAFGAEPFLIAPLTTDAGTILAQVPLLEPAVLPLDGERRTDLALTAAALLLRRSTAAGADVILITDAVAPEAPTRTAAAALAAAGHRVSVLAVAPNAGFAGVAHAGSGVVTPARADDLDTALLLGLRGRPTPDAAGEATSLERQWRDEGPWLLLLTLPLAALAFRRGWLGLLPLAVLLMPPAQVQAGLWSDLWLRPAQRAVRDADAGRLEAALAGVDDPRWQAALRYRAGDYAGALEALAGMDGAEAHYNRGNVLARLGRFEDAAGEYGAALALVPDHADARHNRRLLLELMRRSQAAPAHTGASHDTRRTGDDPRADGAKASDTGGASAGADLGGGQAREQHGAALESELGAAAPPSYAGAGGAAVAPLPAGTGSGTWRRTRAAAGGAPAGLDRSDEPGPGTAADAMRASETPYPQGLQLDAPAVGRQPAREHAASEDPLRADAAADAQLLQQVPDDPSRLLRERLMLQYLRRHGRLH